MVAGANYLGSYLGSLTLLYTSLVAVTGSFGNMNTSNTNQRPLRRAGDTMKNKDLPAMPTPYAEIKNCMGGSDELYCDNIGLTKREVFAKDAPEMPPYWLLTFAYTAEEDELMMKGYGHTEKCECARYTRALIAWRWHYADMMLEGEK